MGSLLLKSDDDSKDQTEKFDAIQFLLKQRGVTKRKPRAFTKQPGLDGTSILTALLLFLPILISATPETRNLSFADDIHNYNKENSKPLTDTLIITIRNKEFTAVLLDNPVASAFKALLPLTMDMIELNGNEKYFDLSKKLPNDAANPGKIYTGDLILYGSKTLVLFYKPFSTSYSYTKLGKINNPSGLAEVLGSGNVSVTVKLK